MMIRSAHWKLASMESAPAPGNAGDLLHTLGWKSAGSLGKVLDVGCNRGWIAGFVEDYYGVDIDEELIRSARSFWAREKGWDANQSEQRLVCQAQPEAWPFPAASFDTVILKDVLEHVEDPIRFLGRCAEVLKPGGTLLLSTPDAQSWVWGDPTHRRPYPRDAHRWLAAALKLEIRQETFESVMPGTQHIARVFGGRSPLPLRLLTRLPFWRRNVVTVLRKPQGSNKA